MFVPPVFKSDDAALTRDLIARNAFGVLTVPSMPDAITHIPMLLVERDGGGSALIGHVSKANSVWRSFDGKTPAVALFMGPHAYISPNWYAGDKARLVPTWNYAAVHVFGKPTALDDDAADNVLQKLVATFEQDATGNWSMDGLDPEFRRRQLKGIVAFEMPIERTETKLKMSQNRAAEDALGAIAGLEAMGDPEALATAKIMRDAMKTRG